ncbi:sodium:proton exchanger [Polaromonas sp.]|uniref:sodium:proton exchanger n=1 Tax=Polaromonas sp. TaxID=1869339 RepID=UPI003BB5D79B
MKRFLIFLLLALAAIVPAIALRVTGARPGALLDVAVFGLAVLAAGFMLSWGAEAAEKRVSQGLILAAVALVTVLPEYAVDLYYAFQAGKAPESHYVHYAAANMTGANRLLVGIAWPLMAFLHWAHARRRSIDLATATIVEVGFLLLASLYAFAIVLKNRIDLFDTLVLVCMFATYLWATARTPKVESETTEDDDPGPAAVLGKLPPSRQWSWTVGLTIVAAAVILACAEPFAESIIAAGRLLKIDEFLLIQWLAPFASEAPAVVIAVLFVLSNRPERGLTAMVSDKINQWTLLVGMLPLAMSFGAGELTALPLDARQHEEFFLTAAQSVFGVGLLLRLRFSLVGAIVLAILFAVQVVVAFIFRDDPARAISSLTTLAWVYIALSIPLYLTRVPGFLRSCQELRSAANNQRLARTASAGTDPLDTSSR